MKNAMKMLLILCISGLTLFGQSGQVPVRNVMTTLGDMIVSDGTGPARLAACANNTVRVADSSVTASGWACSDTVKATYGVTTLDPTSGLLLPVTTSTTSPITVAASGFFRNNGAGAITYNLPTITAAKVGMKFCFRNAVTRTGAITLQLPASTFLDLEGANGTTAGTLVSGGAAGDNVCVVAVSTTQYEASVQRGTWTNN
jgi:hypothetical protein